MPGAYGRDSRDRGFTLLEGILTLAVLAILVGVSYPLYASVSERALQNAAHLIQGDLRLAQQTAVARAASGPRVEFCMRNNGYDIYAVDFIDSLERTGAAAGGNIKVANAGEEYRAGIVVTIDPTATDPCLTDSTRRAIAFSGAGTPISFDDPSAKVITLTFKGGTRRVAIDPATGVATVGR